MQMTCTYWNSRSDVCFTSIHLFVIDVDGDAFTQHQLHGGRVAELHRGFDDQVDAFMWRCDPV